MVKNNPQEQKLKKIDSTLRNFSYNNDVEKIRIYLKSLLTKCLEALAENDYSKYNLAESVLNEHIVRIGVNIDNFEDFYSALKYEVAIDFLKQLLEVDSISVLNNNPVEALIITPNKAKEIKEVYDFLNYSYNKKFIYDYAKGNEYYKFFENEVYSVVFNLAYVMIINKETLSGTYLDSNYSFKFGAEIDVLEGFVTNNPDLITALTITERMVLAENEEDFSADLNFKFIEESVEDGGLAYYNENDSFIVVMNDSLYKIFNKRTGKAFILYYVTGQDNINKTIGFLADFSDYCLGVKGTLNKELLQAEEEVVLDPTEESVEEDLPINEDGVKENG